MDSLLVSAHEEGQSRFIRFPAPILPMPARRRRRGQKKQATGPVDSDSYEEDSEVEEVLAGQPSPWTPFEHSPVLYKQLELLFDQKCTVNVDERLRRSIILGVMRRLGRVLEASRLVHETLDDGALAGNGQFVLELARTEVSEATYEQADARFKAAQQALHEPPA